jgi:hypothetical protein
VLRYGASAVGAVLVVGGTVLLLAGIWVGYVFVSGRSDTSPGAILLLAAELILGGLASIVGGAGLVRVGQRSNDREGSPADRDR